jgi:23S rRNA pseudouridine1911/1915/1917 synthase
MSRPDETIDDADADISELALRFSIADKHAGERLDKALAMLMPDISRSRLQQWVAQGAVLVNGAAVRQRHVLEAGDLIEIEPPQSPEAAAFAPEPMDLDVVYEDKELIVVDKPPGLVVHPAAGHWSGTLANGLLAYAPELAQLPRAGIVHRLDAETSGLMVIARTLTAQTRLVRQLQQRSVMREYWAVVLGAPASAGTVDAPIGRDPRNPLRFRVSHSASAKPARTRYRLITSRATGGATIAWLACRLETGRTHQIRVHMEHIGHPLVGDPLYRRGLPARAQGGSDWRNFRRQALHACRLALEHPASGERIEWFRAPPGDLVELMSGLGFSRLDRPSTVFERAE